MLHDPSHYTPPPICEEIRLNQTDKDTLRRLAGELAEIATLPVHKEKAELWRRLNDLQSVRPMVWINEICWNEMNIESKDFKFDPETELQQSFVLGAEVDVKGDEKMGTLLLIGNADFIDNFGNGHSRP